MAMIFNPGVVGASGGYVISFNTRTGAVTLTSADVTTALGFTPAGLEANNFTGNQVVDGDVIAGDPSSVATIIQPGEILTQSSGGGVGVVINDSSITIHNTNGGWVVSLAADGSKANVSSPTEFDAPVSCTIPPVNPNDLVRLVDIPAGGGVISFNTRTGAVVLTSADVTTALSFTPAGLGANVFTDSQTIGDETTGTVIDSSSLLFYNSSGAWSVSLDSGMAKGIIADPTEFQAAVTSTVAASSANDLVRLTDLTSKAVISFNTRTGAVTLTGGDVTTALGFTPAGKTANVFLGQQVVSFNLSGFDFSAFYNTYGSGATLIGNNMSTGGGETDIINTLGTEGTVGGFRFVFIDNVGTEKILLKLNADTGDAAFLSHIAIGTIDAYTSPAPYYLTIDESTSDVVSRTPPQVLTDLGYVGGFYDNDEFSSTSIVVDLGVTLSSNAFLVNLTPGTTLTATPGWWVDSKTTTSFTVNWPSSLVGVVAFDWFIFPLL